MSAGLAVAVAAALPPASFTLSTNAVAGLATATGTVPQPAAGISVQAGAITVSGFAFSITGQIGRPAQAGLAAATGAALPPASFTLSTNARAGRAAATGAVPPVTVLAEAAVIKGTSTGTSLTQPMQGAGGTVTQPAGSQPAVSQAASSEPEVANAAGSLASVSPGATSRSGVS